MTDYPNYDFSERFVSSEYTSGGKRNFNLDFRESKTPISNPKDNFRKVQIMANVDIDNNHTDFKARVILSGQYSTLTRYAYFGKPVDSTINKKYFDPVWNISDKIRLDEVVR